MTDINWFNKIYDVIMTGSTPVGIPIPNPDLVISFLTMEDRKLIIDFIIFGYQYHDFDKEKLLAIIHKFDSIPYFRDDKGFLPTVKAIVQANLPKLSEMVDEGIANNKEIKMRALHVLFNISFIKDITINLDAKIQKYLGGLSHD